MVTTAATILSRLLTMLLLFCGFALLIHYGGIVTIFPPKVMETWPTVDPAVGMN